MTAKLSPVPAALQSAIDKAAAAFKVPADLLAGIWRVEAGSTYPNPYVNSSGYGGLFGTKDWNGPALEQAKLAASVLASGLRASRGNVAEALSYYNTGKLTGGYTSVPGETTFGTVTVPPSGVTITVPRQTGAAGGAQDVSLGGDLKKGLTHGLFDLPPFNTIGSMVDLLKKVLDDPEATLGHALLYLLLLFLGVVLVFEGFLRLTGSSYRPSNPIVELAKAGVA